MGFTDEREAQFEDQLELRTTDVERTKGNSRRFYKRTDAKGPTFHVGSIKEPTQKVVKKPTRKV